MAATTITPAMLNGLREHVADMVAYARYRIGSTWYRAEIYSKGVQSNGAVHVAFYIQASSSVTTPANRFRLYDSNGTILAERSETVSFDVTVSRMLYRFKFGVTAG